MTASKKAGRSSRNRAVARHTAAATRVMSSDVGTGVLALPAIRGVMGEWVYYTASMRLQEVAARVRLAQDIHQSATLSEMIQRAVSNRSREIAEYLRQQPSERFFNALVVGVYRGDPEWHDIDIRANPYLDEAEVDRIDGQLGAFVLQGSELLYAIDGQHRVVGIQRALREDAAIGADNIVVTFVPYDTSATSGLLRTRRLFTTLNRYAKPVSQRDRIALDEDDVIAIVARRLIEQYPLFQDKKISASRAKSLSPSDRTSVTTVAMLYDVLEFYFRRSRRDWTKYKRIRPSDSELENYYAEAVSLWDDARLAFSALDAVATSQPEDETAGRFRTREGGHLIFRPVGLRTLVRALVAFEQLGVQRLAAFKRLASVPLDLSSIPWAGILYDPTTRRMLTAKENQQAALGLWFYMAGGPLSTVKLSEEKLRELIAGLTSRTVGDVELPPRMRRAVKPKPAAPTLPSEMGTRASAMSKAVHRSTRGKNA